jgi:hypothetical protein
MKTTTTTLFFSLAIGLLVFGLAPAGTLDPPGPPAPTMVPLTSIFNKWGVPKTGQTACWDAAGTSISCTNMGMDGTYQAGVSVGPRFTNNNDGTVKDNLTGLIWLQNANCGGPATWTGALSRASTLATGNCGLSDGSVAGAWRLPNVKEMHSLIDFSQASPALSAGHPFLGVFSGRYWSSTSNVFSPSFAWYVSIENGSVGPDLSKTGAISVWPVRGGR